MATGAAGPSNRSVRMDEDEGFCESESIAGRPTSLQSLAKTSLLSPVHASLADRALC